MKSRLLVLAAAFALAFLGITAAIAATIVANPASSSNSSASSESSPRTNTSTNTPPSMIATDEDSCADGAWMELRRADGTPFHNETDCLAYIHHRRGNDGSGSRGNDDTNNNKGSGYVEPGGDNGGHGGHFEPDDHGGR